MRSASAAMVTALILLATSGCSTDADPAPVQRDGRSVLAVQQLRQEPMLCVPTSAAMVLAFYGDPRSPRLLKSLSSGREYDPNAPFTDFTITSYDSVIRAVGSLGYDWVQHSFANDDDGFDKGLALIETELRNGHPVLVDATLPSGHTFVLRGFDSDEHMLFAADPNEASPGQRRLSFDAFKTVWNETAYGNDFRVLIVTRPRSNASSMS